MAPLWEQAVKFVGDSESRVREETQLIEGEEFHVWRWLQVRSTFCFVLRPRLTHDLSFCFAGLLEGKESVAGSWYV